MVLHAGRQRALELSLNSAQLRVISGNYISLRKLWQARMNFNVIWMSFEMLAPIVLRIREFTFALIAARHRPALADQLDGARHRRARRPHDERTQSAEVGFR
jgi:hypothetical protein